MQNPPNFFLASPIAAPTSTSWEEDQDLLERSTKKTKMSPAQIEGIGGEIMMEGVEV